jgi:ClpP class serine protease
MTPVSVYMQYGLPTSYAGGDDEATMRLRKSLFPPAPRVEWTPEQMGFLEIVGPLEFADYSLIRVKVDALAKNPRVQQVLAYMNCPGGVASGAVEAANAIGRLNKQKPILCVAEGLCCSAGYMLASQCAELVLSPTTLTGSVGTRFVLIDDSALFERLGIKVIPVSTGDDKNIGLEGVPVDDAQVAAIERRVQSHQRQFIMSLKRSPFLNAERIVALALRAEIWLGEDAVALGFAHRLGTWEEISDELHGKFSERQAAQARQSLESLTGQMALDEFDRLTCEAAGCDYFDEAPAPIVSQIRSEYPRLARAADERAKSLESRAYRPKFLNHN